MPADRRITIHIQAQGTRTAAGLYVDGASTHYPMWATREDLGAEYVLEERGNRDELRRNWIVRWFAALDAALTHPSRVTVTDGAETFNVARMREITESGQRRRFVRIEGVFSAT